MLVEVMNDNRSPFNASGTEVFSDREMNDLFQNFDFSGSSVGLSADLPAGIKLEDAADMSAAPFLQRAALFTPAELTVGTEAWYTSPPQDPAAFLPYTDPHLYSHCRPPPPEQDHDSSGSEHTNQRSKKEKSSEKGTHSETERKRRDLMNEKISQLKELVPGFEQAKPNKVTVLGKAVEYMQELKQGNVKLERDTEDLRAEISRLRKLSLRERGRFDSESEGDRKRSNLFDLPLPLATDSLSKHHEHASETLSLPDMTLKQFIAAALRITMENLIVTDPNVVGHPIVYSSTGFQRMTQYSEKEIVGRNCRFLQGTATDRGVTMEIGRAIRDRKEYLAEILNYRKDGTPFWNLVYINPVVDADDRPIVFIGVQFDITSSKNCPDRMLQMKGSRNGNRLEAWVTPRVKVAQAQKKARLLDYDPDSPPAGSTLDAPSPEAAGLICGATPNEELKEFLASVLNMAMNSLIVIDGKGTGEKGTGRGTIVHVNNGFCRMTGYSREDALGKRLSFLEGPASDTNAVRAIARCLDDRRPNNLLTEVVHYRKDGSTFWDLISVTAVPDTHGEVALFIILNFDVSNSRC
uniref:Putative LOV domain-containing protein n=1 Tax=Glaucocystis sp. BC-2016 TaxID=1802912 RepID=A0A126X0M4_9EUKA|nr:putative LOV domain-containing protein [Glaucocystis sp. BC-2016]